MRRGRALLPFSFIILQFYFSHTLLLSSICNHHSSIIPPQADVIRFAALLQQRTVARHSLLARKGRIRKTHCSAGKKIVAFALNSSEFNRRFQGIIYAKIPNFPEMITGISASGSVFERSGTAIRRSGHRKRGVLPCQGGKRII